jgi:large subunit ribosomal protein L6
MPFTILPFTIHSRRKKETLMSRIGKKPVAIPAGVTAAVSGQTVTAKGPKGELRFVVNDEVLVKLENNEISVEPSDQSKDARSKWGMSRTQIVNISPA